MGLIRAAIAGLSALMLVTGAVAQEPQTVTVFAAASLTEAFEEIGAGFEAEHPGVEVLFNFAGSSDLAAQLAEGAPADVFASANSTQMQAAVDAGRTVGEPQIFARNRLVVIVPADNPAQIETLADLAMPGIALVLASPGVPVRDYTDAMLTRMAESPDYGAAFRDGVLANVVSEEPNVRQVAAKVSLGEADAGIVYRSDVTPDLSASVISLSIPDEFNTLAAYPIARTDDPANPQLAEAFTAYVLSPNGQTALAHWNFIPVETDETCARGQSPMALLIGWLLGAGNC